MKKASKISKPVRCCFLHMIVYCIVLHAVSLHASDFSGKTFTSPNRLVTSLKCDQNYIWAGTSNVGLLKIHKQTGETILYGNDEFDTSCRNIVAFDIDKNGNPLVGTYLSRVVQFDGTHWTQLSGSPDKYMIDMVLDRQGTIWAWYDNAGIVCFDGTSWQTKVSSFNGKVIRSEDGNIWMMNLPLDSVNWKDSWIHEYDNNVLKTSISLASVYNELRYMAYLCVDSKKNCWTATLDNLIKINTTSVNRFPLPSGKYLTSMAINDEKLLFSVYDTSDTCDVYICDEITGKEELSMQKLFSLDSQYIVSACSDPANGGFWCWTSNGKMIFIDAQNGHTIKQVGDPVLPSNFVSSLIFDKTKKLWIGTANGLVQYDNTQWTLTSRADSLPGFDVSTLSMDSSGTLWAGFRQPLISSAVTSGISSYSGDHWHLVKRDHISVRALSFDNTGNQWIVSDDGVFRNNQQQPERVFQTLHSGERNDILGTTVNTIAFDKGNIPWIGTGLGIKRFENSIWTDDTTINKYLPSSGPLKDGVAVNAICFAGNNVWIGTSYGLFKISDGICLRFDTTDSVLPDLTVQCIFAESADNVWIGTKKGLVHLDGENHVTYTSKNTSLYVYDVTACTKSPDGDIWVGTRMGGLTVIPKSVAINSISGFPRIAFSQQSVTVSAWKHSDHINVTLNCSGSGRIDFSIVSLDGKLIRCFSKVSAGGEPVTFTWNYVDKNGLSVAQNMFLGIITLNGRVIDKLIMH